MSERQRRNLGEKEVRRTAYGRCRGDSDEIPERRRSAGPPTGDVGATTDEILERRRHAGPPADSAGHL